MKAKLKKSFCFNLSMDLILDNAQKSLDVSIPMS